MYKGYATRSVHLDFHTSPLIENVGKDFDPDLFAKTYKDSNIESVTVFAKCHHGYSYYPSKIGEMHPQLKFDLLKAQVEALQKEGIKAPVYFTVGWSEADIVKFPECIHTNKSGARNMAHGVYNSDLNLPRPEAAWVTFCTSGGYADMIYSQVTEICEKFEKLDGMFFDIVFHTPVCYCPTCLKGMTAEKVDITDDDAVRAYGVRKMKKFCGTIMEIIQSRHKNATVYFNNCHYTVQGFHNFPTHFELEDLPSVWGGYNKLPFSAAFFQNFDKYYSGMTGKFHTMWGEFGGNKSAQALKTEAAQMLTYGAGMGIGDHMHPNCFLDKTTYSILKEVFAYIKKLESFCIGGQPTTKLAIIPSFFQSSDFGISKMLIESQLDFAVAMQDGDWSKYDCLIFPDGMQYNEELAKKARDFSANGGAILVLGNSLTKDGKSLIDDGSKQIQKSEFDCDYIFPKSGTTFSVSPILMYKAGTNIVCDSGFSLGELYNPYFSRTYGKFCSHINTPYKNEKTGFSCGTKKGKVIRLAHNIGTLYNEKGAQLHKEFFISALKSIYNQPELTSEIGNGGRVRLTKFEEKNRYVFNAMYFMSTKCGDVEVVQDVFDKTGLNAKICIKEKVRRVYSIQQNKDISFTQNDSLCFDYDIFDGHNTIVIEY